MVFSFLEPWRETGSREIHPQPGRWKCGSTLRQCLSFADSRNQAVRAVASRHVPGARSFRGPYGPSPPDQKTRPGGSLPSAPSEQPQRPWQPWPHPRGRGWTPLDVQDCGWLPLAIRWPWAAHWLALTSANTCVELLLPSLPPSAVGLRLLWGGNRCCQCDDAQELSHSPKMEARDCFDPCRLPRFQCKRCYLLALCFWVGYLTSLRLWFLS